MLAQPTSLHTGGSPRWIGISFTGERFLRPTSQRSREKVMPASEWHCPASLITGLTAIKRQMCPLMESRVKVNTITSLQTFKIPDCIVSLRLSQPQCINAGSLPPETVIDSLRQRTLNIGDRCLVLNRRVCDPVAPLLTPHSPHVKFGRPVR